MSLQSSCLGQSTAPPSEPQQNLKACLCRSSVTTLLKSVPGRVMRYAVSGGPPISKPFLPAALSSALWASFS